MFDLSRLVYIGEGTASENPLNAHLFIAAK